MQGVFCEGGRNLCGLSKRTFPLFSETGGNLNCRRLQKEWRKSGYNSTDGWAVFTETDRSAVDAAFAGAGVLDYSSGSQCAFSNAYVRFYKVGDSMPQCVGVKPCLAGKSAHGWGILDGQLGGFRHAAAYGHILSHVYPAGGLWSAAADCVSAGWAVSSGRGSRQTGIDPLYGFWLQCRRSYGVPYH